MLRWTAFWCFFTSASTAKAFPHTKQLWSLVISWTYFMCCLSTHPLLNVLEHFSHSKARSFLWTSVIWEMRACLVKAEWLHSFSWQGNNLRGSPWICSLCLNIKRKIPCQICPKKLQSLFELRRHIMSAHEKLKPYACSQCNFKSSFQGSLVKHIESFHNNVKAEKCPHCPRSFDTKHSLQRHITRCHDTAKEECPACGLEFRVMSSHIRKVHLTM